jgi:hypothetical protein
MRLEGNGLVEVTDSNKARGALTFIGIVCFAEAGIGVLSQLAPSLISTFGGMEAFDRWRTAQQGLWLIASLAAAVALFQLSQAVKEPELVFSVLGAFALVACVELYWFYDGLTRSLDVPRATPRALSYLSMGLVLVANLGLVGLIGKLGRSTPLAAGLGVFMAVRSLGSMGLMRSAELRPPIWIYSFLGILSLSISIGVGALALHAGRAVAGPAPAPGAVPAPITDSSGIRLILTGLALLVLGIGGSAFSYSLASSGAGGGRYLVATGVIATGFVQLVRGVARLGR